MTFKALYPSATKFKYVIQTIAKIVDEIPFKAKEDGLVVKTLSPDKTTMMVATIPATAFESYSVEGEAAFIVASDEMNRVVKRGARNDFVELELDSRLKRLNVTFIDKKTSVTRRFYIPLREGVVEDLGEPKVELEAEARMLTDDFKNIIRDAKLVGDELEFLARENKLEVKCASSQKEYHGVLEVGKPLVSLNVARDGVSARYSIDLLGTALKAASAADTVTVEFGTNLPMRITFELPGGGSIVFWVAPRV